MGYHQKAKCSQHGCRGILRIKHQGCYAKSASWDDQGENDHFSSTTLV
jgi:hypothetical protein